MAVHQTSVMGLRLRLFLFCFQYRNLVLSCSELIRDGSTTELVHICKLRIMISHEWSITYLEACLVGDVVGAKVADFSIFSVLQFV